MSTYTSLRDLFSDIADAIRAKTHDDSALTPAEFPDEIGTITAGADLSVVTAAAGDVRSGKKFVNASGTTVTGTITEISPDAITLPVGGSYTIPAGIHTGSGVVSQTVSTKAATNHYVGPVQQTIIPAGTYCTGAQVLKPITATNLTAANIKSGVTIKVNNGNEDVFDVTGTFSQSNGKKVSKVCGNENTQIWTKTTGGGLYLPYAEVSTSEIGFIPDAMVAVNSTNVTQQVMWTKGSYSDQPTFQIFFFPGFSYGVHWVSTFPTQIGDTFKVPFYQNTSGKTYHIFFVKE